MQITKSEIVRLFSRHLHVHATLTEKLFWLASGTNVDKHAFYTHARLYLRLFISNVEGRRYVSAEIADPEEMSQPNGEMSTVYWFFEHTDIPLSDYSRPKCAENIYSVAVAALAVKLPYKLC